MSANSSKLAIFNKDFFIFFSAHIWNMEAPKMLQIVKNIIKIYRITSIITSIFVSILEMDFLLVGSDDSDELIHLHIFTWINLVLHSLMNASVHLYAYGIVWSSSVKRMGIGHVISSVCYLHVN